MHKDFQNLRDDANIMKYLQFGKMFNPDLNKNTDIKLTNLKSKTGSDSFITDQEKNTSNYISFPVNENNISFLTINHNNINIRKEDILFPKLNKIKITKPTNSLEKKSVSSLSNELTKKWIKKLTLNNKENSFIQKNSLITNEEKRDSINSYNNDKNKIIFGPPSLNSENNRKFIKIPKKFNLQKYKNVKYCGENIIKCRNITPSNYSSRIIHPILGLTKLPPQIIQKNSSKKKIKKIKSLSPTQKETIETKDRTEKLHLLNNIFKTIGSTSPLKFKGKIPFKREVKLGPEIFINNYKNFKESIISKNEDIYKNDIIKGFAYNTSQGNIRPYNEDEICISKIFFNSSESSNDKYDLNNKNFCHFFAIYDGHGGKGCSSYLKEHLHKNIPEFSSIGIKIGIDIVEENFKTKKCLNEKGEIIDMSGSCGIMLMIQGKKCIIANIGDSRLVIFRNKKIAFNTIDHKPDSIIEKARIELSGGKLYKAQSLLPIYQNGMRVEAPWRIMPGRLSVSRTFGDIMAKEEKFGGNKTAIIALPDITEIELDNQYNFIIIGCDGIFDVLKNEELLECIEIVLKEKNITNLKDINIHELCGDFAAMIIKSALAKDSFDNVSCIVIVINLEPFLSNE